MTVTSRDHQINAALGQIKPLVEGQQQATPQQQAAEVEKQLRTKGINAVARVESSGDINVKRVLIG